jgi:hypothetical protein
MKINIFQRFEDIPNSNLLLDKIPVFATPNYANYLKETKNQVTFWFTSVENDSPTFLIPFVINKKIIFRKGYFITGVVSLNSDNSIEKEAEFLEDVVSYIKENKICDWIQQGPNWALFNTFPTGSKAVEFGTYKILLKDRSETELYSSIKKNCRQDINRVQRGMIIIKKGIEYLDDCLKVINRTAKIANLQLLNTEDVKKLYFSFKDKLMISVSYLENTSQSGAIFLGNEYCTYALYAGSINKALRGANAYLDWEAIRDAKNNNSICFDFVGARVNPIPGSKQERIQNYKKHFGCEFVRGYIWKIVISKWKFHFYNMLLKIYFLISNKKIKKDIIDQELDNKNNEDIHTDD